MLQEINTVKKSTRHLQESEKDPCLCLFVVAVTHWLSSVILFACSQSSIHLEYTTEVPETVHSPDDKGSLIIHIIVALVCFVFIFGRDKQSLPNIRLVMVNLNYSCKQTYFSNTNISILFTDLQKPFKV